MKLFHGSFEKITEITKIGTFDEFLFFSSNYDAAASHGKYVYSLDINKEEFIKASSLFYHDDCDKIADVTQQVQNYLDVSKKTAEELLDETTQLENGSAEDSWWLQTRTAEAAKKLGYRGAIVNDEYGASYLIDMLDHITDLKLTKEN